MQSCGMTKSDSGDDDDDDDVPVTTCLSGGGHHLNKNGAQQPLCLRTA